jgi:hypothetical protein
MYLRSAGFSNYKKRNDIKILLDKLERANIDKMRAVHFNGDEMRWEINAKVTPTMGVYLIGAVDNGSGDYIREYYFPYINSEDKSLQLPCSIQRKIDYDIFSGVVEDERMNISLIFRLNNNLEYLDRFIKRKSVDSKAIYLSAWSGSGKVILPVGKASLNYSDSVGEEKNKKYDLFEKTDGIDDDSFSSLSEDIYLYNSVSKRLLREDVYSIVDSCFVPYGIECEIYSVLGNILRVESYKNYYTDELIYDLTLECNDILLHVGINKRDLEGEPLAGRRFRGVIWLQGRIEFEEDKI